MTRKYRISFSPLLNKIIMLLILALPLFLITGCSVGENITGSKNSKKEIKVGICLYDEYDVFVSSIKDEMIKWAKEKEQETGIKITLEVEYVNSKGSQITQNDQVEKFISRNFDVLCVNIVDRTDSMVIIDKAMSSNTPIVFFNRELVQEDLNRWDKLYYVGAAPAQSARIQSEIIIDDLSDPDKFESIDYNHDGVIQYVMLEGEKGHQDAIVRTQVCIDEIQKAGFKIERLGDEFANWDRDQAKTKIMEVIRKYPSQIEMVIANNDSMALGSLDAFSESDYPHSVYVIGVDGLDEALQNILTRKLAGSVKNDNIGQANAIMTIAFALANEEEIPDSVNLTFGKYALIPYKKITEDNVYEFTSNTR